MNSVDFKAELLDELRHMIQDSGSDGDLSSLEAWFEDWIHEPTPLLSGAASAQTLGSAAGREEVRDLLRQMRGGLPA